MASANVIEVGDVTAGIVVFDRNAFRFFASERAFHPLEGAMFRTIDEATRAARACLQPRGKPGRGQPIHELPDARQRAVDEHVGRPEFVE